MNTTDDKKATDLQKFITDMDEKKYIAVPKRPTRHAINNQLMSAYGAHFEAKSKENRQLKRRFFYLVFALNIILILSLMTICIILSINGVDEAKQTGIIITSLVSALSVVIVLPTVIGKYLYQQNEDAELLKFMLEMDKLENPTNQR